MSLSAIAFCTLSFSGSRVLTTLNFSVYVVIIDKAAQAMDPPTLVPLSNGCKQAFFFIGDSVQLLATVTSPLVEKFGYGMSLLKRFWRTSYLVKKLKT